MIDCRVTIMFSPFRIYKDFEYKKQLAISLATNYSRLAKNFIADSHDHDVCVCLKKITNCMLTCTCVLHELTYLHDYMYYVSIFVCFSTPGYEPHCTVIHQPFTRKIVSITSVLLKCYTVCYLIYSLVC